VGPKALTARFVAPFSWLWRVDNCRERCSFSGSGFVRRSGGRYRPGSFGGGGVRSAGSVVSFRLVSVGFVVSPRRSEGLPAYVPRMYSSPIFRIMGSFAFPCSIALQMVGCRGLRRSRPLQLLPVCLRSVRFRVSFLVSVSFPLPPASFSFRFAVTFPQSSFRPRFSASVSRNRPGFLVRRAYRFLLGPCSQYFVRGVPRVLLFLCWP